MDVIKLPCPSELKAIVLHPKIELKTMHAREILKNNVSLKKAVTQWGNLAAFISALYTEDFDLMSRSLVDEIVELMARANAAFNKKLSDLAFVQACGCEPCTQSKNLRLKICAHKGNFSLNTIRNFEELSGEDVILTHRMLKNDIESSEYWLVTAPYHKTLNSVNRKKFTKITQNLESFDKVKLNYLELGSPEPRNELSLIHI